jgi:hypothetical protein
MVESGMETMILKREAEAFAAGNYEKVMFFKWQLACESQTDCEEILLKEKAEVSK